MRVSGIALSGCAVPAATRELQRTCCAFYFDAQTRVAHQKSVEREMAEWRTLHPNASLWLLVCGASRRLLGVDDSQCRCASGAQGHTQGQCHNDATRSGGLCASCFEHVADNSKIPTRRRSLEPTGTTHSTSTAQPRAPRASPHPKSVMHPASNSRDAHHVHFPCTNHVNTPPPERRWLSDYGSKPDRSALRRNSGELALRAS